MNKASLPSHKSNKRKSDRIPYDIVIVSRYFMFVRLEEEWNLLLTRLLRWSCDFVYGPCNDNKTDNDMSVCVTVNWMGLTSSF